MVRTAQNLSLTCPGISPSTRSYWANPTCGASRLAFRSRSWLKTSLAAIYSSAWTTARQDTREMLSS
jgi:hypothetical protein